MRSVFLQYLPSESALGPVVHALCYMGASVEECASLPRTYFSLQGEIASIAVTYTHSSTVLCKPTPSTYPPFISSICILAHFSFERGQMQVYPIIAEHLAGS